MRRPDGHHRRRRLSQHGAVHAAAALLPAGGGNEDFFATDAVDFDAGVVDAAMLRSRASYLRALAEAEKLPELSSDDLTAAPGLGQSTGAGGPQRGRAGGKTVNLIRRVV